MIEIPGELVTDRGKETFLRQTVAHICQVEHTRFPGSQPVSFKTADIERLQREDYWVCEKSDGVRVLLFILPFPNGQEIYLIDRKNSYRLVHGLYFPHFEDKQRALGHTMIDGELVMDVDPQTNVATMRFLAFDCMVCDGQNVMNRPLQKRYGRLKMHVLDPFLRMLQEIPPMREQIPFQLQLKKMELSYIVEKVIKEDIPKLQHGSDGLIYTNAEKGYVVGTDQTLLKWKPPSENTIDFKLELRFPPLPNPSSSTAGPSTEPDFSAKPVFILNAFHGGGRGGGYQYFDLMEVDDQEWEKMKATGNQYDDRIVEVAWDMERENWKFMRFRDDKTDGNHISVIDNIIESIKDGVEQIELLEAVDAVKTSWKARAHARSTAPPSQPQAQPPPQAQAHSHSHPQNQQAPTAAHRSTSIGLGGGGVGVGASSRSDWKFPMERIEKYPDDDIRSGPLYSKVSGPPQVDGIWR